MSLEVKTESGGGKTKKGDGMQVWKAEPHWLHFINIWPLFALIWRVTWQAVRTCIEIRRSGWALNRLPTVSTQSFDSRDGHNT